MRNFPSPLFEAKAVENSVNHCAKKLVKRGYKYRGVTIKGEPGVTGDYYVFGKKGSPTLFLGETCLESKARGHQHIYAFKKRDLDDKVLDEYLRTDVTDVLHLPDGREIIMN